MFNLLLLAGIVAARTAVFEDCSTEADLKQGKFGAGVLHNQTWNDTIFWTLVPENQNGLALPLMVFMHGSAGQWGFYNDSLSNIASHGAIIVFPYIKDPEKDKSPFTTNTNGKYLVKAIEYARAMNEDKDSFLYQAVDTSNIAIAGHSMGATCSIEASHTLKDDPTIKLTVTMHPGICGPFGPPPSPNTWMPNTLKEVAQSHPVLFTTAHNDGAFWPAPETAKHEFGCWNSAIGEAGSKHEEDTKGAIFVEFTQEACDEDGAREPFCQDGGHMCPSKIANGGAPEFPWVLRAFKLYAQHDQSGNPLRNCQKLMWEDQPGSLKNSEDAQIVDQRTPVTSFESFLL